LTRVKAVGEASFYLGTMMSDKIVRLDVREEFRRAQPPFPRIMNTVSGLLEGQELLLVAPIEPVPLFSILAQRGFGHASRQIESGDWEVRFSRDLAVSNAAAGVKADRPTAGATQARTPDFVELDARQLEPPEPMIRILQALTTLSPGAELRARTDRRPLHLYAQLESRGFTGVSDEQSDGSFITHIRRSGE
jgi:uncharacterized protein (DUF2249 family)